MTLYATSDTHFGHHNIIKYCDRPFRGVDDMDKQMVRRWNGVVKPWDEVIHCGDFCMQSGRIGHFINSLNGRKTFLTGNHDRYMRHTREYVCKPDMGILFIHKPEDPIAKRWLDSNPDHWVIHGHHHSNAEEYPLINHIGRTINVSVELTEYAPIRVDTLLEMI